MLFGYQYIVDEFITIPSLSVEAAVSHVKSPAVDLVQVCPGVFPENPYIFPIDHMFTVSPYEYALSVMPTKEYR